MKKIEDDMRHVYLTTKEIDTIVMCMEQNLDSGQKEFKEITGIIEYLKRTKAQER